MRRCRAAAGFPSRIPGIRLETAWKPGIRPVSESYSPQDDAVAVPSLRLCRDPNTIECSIAGGRAVRSRRERRARRASGRVFAGDAPADFTAARVRQMRASHTRF